MYFICTCIGSRCSGNSVQDVVFVIDASGSIGASRFELIRDFTVNITADLICNSPRNTFGVILFKEYADIEFNLKAYTSLSTIISAINQLPYNNGRTDTAKALTLLLSTAQDGTLGLRDDSLKVAIVITDGYSNSPLATSSAAAALHASNIFDVYAVGVGGADQTELETIASSPEFVFFTNSFNDVGLQQLQMQIVQQLCSRKSLYTNCMHKLQSTYACSNVYDYASDV